MSIRRRIKVETRDRKDVLAEALIPQDEFLQRFFANPTRFQFFFGAGMSASAGIPLAQEIVEEIIIRVFEKSNPAKRGQVDADDLRDWVAREKWFNPNHPYISALEKEYPSVILRTELFKRHMRGKFPSPAQLMYSIGVKEKKLNNRCYTTNWDTLTEDAFYWLRGTNCTTIKGPEQLREVKDTEHNFVVKFHGDIDRYDVRYLREGMAKHNDDLRDFLIQSLSGVGLVIVGYSGAEYSVMNMLMEISHDHPDVLSGGLFWAYTGNTKHIPESITDLMAIGLDKGKDFRIFEAEEADFLMDRISRELSFTSIEEELSNAFFRFNKMGYGELRNRMDSTFPGLDDLAHRDLLDEGFLVRDYNAIHEVWKQDSKGMFKKKEEKERAKNEAERKFVNHVYNDLKHENYSDAEVKFKDVLSHFPENEAAIWGLGWLQYKTGRYEESLQSFEEALRLNPKNHSSHIVRAMCYHNLERYSEEAVTYDRILELKGNLDYIWYNRGVAAARLGDFEMEKESYESATAANPGNYMGWYNLGLCYNSVGANKLALRCFSRASDISPRLFQAIYNSGILLGKMGQDVQAISCFERCIELDQEDDETFKCRGIAELMISNFEQSVESYEEFLSAKPDDQESWANMSAALYGVERYKDGSEYVEKYLSVNPQDARIWYNKALLLYKQGNLDEAMSAFDKSLSINDDYDMVWYRKAMLMGELGQYEGQIDLLAKFLSTNAQDLRGWFQLGEANRKLGMSTDDLASQQKFFSAAVKAYDSALDVQRTDTATWLQKAICLNKLHRYEEALECLKFLERYDKFNPEIYYQKGLAMDGLEDHLGAVDILNECIKLDADHEGAYYRRGLLLAELEQFAKAVDHFENVLRINEDKWQAYHYKGVCIIQQKEYDRALQVFMEGASRYPGQARFYVDQALAYIMMRETDSAREKLLGALAIDESLREEITNTPEFSGLL